ncbi:T9SS type A sorting domain-containing protein [Marixanthomonas ophiurae]|uniref:T9SS C-terminal target domain-containing protein n=1 Tax=Marixanthomonas ophiurae TaxID=387659 RepID=A0A3E1Q8E2_9FLAO|nr:T9SS type A sorting domain-containing protein [Marixanthomonas ophiurae]RFN58417.1 T9SS C-terminal target domain-containing protein [Marixanthomonas ophiurae]
MKIFIFSLLFISLSFHSLAQQAFFPYTVIDNTFGVENPNQTKLADIDSDGDLDIFLQSNSFSNLTWLPNIDGEGNYGTGNVVAQENVGSVQSSDIGDINGDGHVDILRGSTTVDRIDWDANDGTGVFSTLTTVDEDITNPRILILTDIDGDSDLDILVYYYEGANRFGWFENLDGLGNFGEVNEIGFDGGSSNRIRMVTADIDGDSDMDLLVSNSSTSTVFWYENLDGMGSFSNLKLIDDTQTSSMSSVLLSDIDGDSDLDLLISVDLLTSQDEDLIVAYENLDGNGNFGASTIVSNIFNSPKHMNAVDLDTDGDQDLVIANTEGKNTIWLPNDGNGNFGPAIIFEEYVFSPSHISIADIDSNGTPDIISTAYSEDTVTTYKNLDGQGTLEPGVIVNSTIQDPTKVVLADLDGDGDNDIANISHNKVSWYENLDGLGTYGQQNVLVGNVFVGRFLEAVDFDNDGDLDLMYGYDEVVSWVENLDGAGNFSERQALHIAGGTNSDITFMDVDNDLDLDYVRLSSLSLIWHENINSALENLGNTILSNISLDLGQINKIDVNGDGFIDLVGSTSGDNQLIWIPNQGDGTFGAFQVIDTDQPNIRRAGIKAADIDGDSDLDIVSGSPDNNTVLWYENLDGLGAFGDANEISTTISMNKVLEVFDSDSDGDPDIIVSDLLTNTVQFIENIDWGSSFAEPIELFGTDLTFTSSLAFGELNGDFKQDLAISNTQDGSILWYENLGVLSNVISGNVAIDLDSNGCDPGDPDMQNLLIKTENETHSFSTVTNANGDYSISVTEGTFTTQINSSLPTHFSSEPESHVSEFVGINNAEVKDFCVVATETIEDISIGFFPITDARPGFEAVYELVYSNIGTVIVDGDIELNFDDVRLEYSESSEPVASSSTGQITFDYTNLQPFETRTIQITFSVAPPPTTQIDDPLIFSGQINPVSNDINPEDNSFNYTQIVIGSFDPNDILVLEGPQVHIDDADDYLHYIIRFQNTGTASAINVRVLNELDMNLDWDSFQLLNTSHESRVEITEGNTMQFIFDDINLPDAKTDEEGSKGHIQYKIKPMSPVSVGDQVSNNAQIYFDFNEFILTNTVTTTYVEQLGVESFREEIIYIYPNPVENKLFIIGVSNYSKISIYDLPGHKIMEQKIVQDSVSLNVEHISRGVYFLKFENNNGNFEIRRLIKK